MKINIYNNKQNTNREHMLLQYDTSNQLELYSIQRCLCNNNIVNLVFKMEWFCICLIFLGMEFQFIGDIHLKDIPLNLFLL